jgi:hypothetical protein
MRSRILGGIGVLLGGGILVSRFLQGGLVRGSGAYMRSQLVGLGLATLLFGVGCYYLLKGGSKRDAR